MFNNNYDTKKIITIVLVFFVIYSLFGTMTSQELLYTLLTLPGLVLALTIHEFSHAKMSDKLGDPTPERQGRLTLNPLAHMDVAGTVCLLFAGFGWGKPVQIDPTYYRNPSRDNMLVALAGPLSNMILAFISFVVYGFIYYLLPQDQLWAQILIIMVLFCAQINLSLGVFNLLPFPPLDGSKILTHFLKGKAKEVIWTLEKYSIIIIMILFFTELPSLLISPVVTWLAEKMLMLSELIVGVFL